MRIAVISDVHGNLPALERVLEDIVSRDADAIWCLGDIAFKGPAPGECARLLRDRSVTCILGNTDMELLSVADAKGRTPQNTVPTAPSLQPPVGSVPYYRWHVDHMAPEELRFLSSLPESIETMVDGVSVSLHHAASDDPVRALFHASSPEGFAARLNRAAASYVLVGHTHQASVISAAGKTMVNPGAVGFSLDMNWRASYALIEPRTGSASIIRVDYDIDAAADLARRRNFCFSPTWYSDALRLGWWEPVPWDQRAATIDRLS